MTREELDTLFPVMGNDHNQAQKLIALGYPTVAPVLDTIILRSIDANPVSLVFFHFVKSLSSDQLVAPITELLTTLISDGDGTKSQILRQYVEDNEDLSRKLTKVLMYLSDSDDLLFHDVPDVNEERRPIPHTVSITSSASLTAFEILVKFNLVQYQWASKVLVRKEREFEWKMHNFNATKDALNALRAEFLARMPQDTEDVAAAEALVTLGYPVVSPILNDILRESIRNNPVALVYRNLFKSVPERELYHLFNDGLWFKKYDEDQKTKLISIYIENDRIFSESMMRELSMVFVLLARYSESLALRIQALSIVVKNNLYDEEWIKKTSQDLQRILDNITERLNEISRENT
jgi:hypothetical protein